ncbi:hypothetical protein [Halocatena halophila]|uniref:hypothetical protein n=1 Tax=Halocatena halophila TaxID=2814576 RepID=UPI002ED12AAC
MFNVNADAAQNRTTKFTSNAQTVLAKGVVYDERTKRSCSVEKLVSRAADIFRTKAQRHGRQMGHPERNNVPASTEEQFDGILPGPMVRYVTPAGAMIKEPHDSKTTFE